MNGSYVEPLKAELPTAVPLKAEQRKIDRLIELMIDMKFSLNQIEGICRGYVKPKNKNRKLLPDEEFYDWLDSIGKLDRSSGTLKSMYNE